MSVTEEVTEQPVRLRNMSDKQKRIHALKIKAGEDGMRLAKSYSDCLLFSNCVNTGFGLGECEGCQSYRKPPEQPESVPAVDLADVAGNSTASPCAGCTPTSYADCNACHYINTPKTLTYEQGRDIVLQAFSDESVSVDDFSKIFNRITEVMENR